MVLRLIAAAVIPALLAMDALTWMAERWSDDRGYFGHGPFVPAVAGLWAAWLVRARRHRGGGAVWISLPLVFLGSALLYLLIGRGVSFFGAVGWWLSTVGLIAAAVGWRGARSLVGPLGLLLFMIPWPLKLVEDLSLPLKGWALTLGGMMAPTDVVRQGSQLIMPDASVLVVGDVCSGLRSLVASIAFAYVLAAMTRTSLLGKVTIVALAAPVAVLVNAARIVLLVHVAAGSGADAAGAGTMVHDLSGVFAFILGMGILMGAARLMPRPAPTTPLVPAAPPKAGSFAIAALVLVLGPVLAEFEGAVPPPPLPDGVLAEIPGQLLPPPGSGGAAVPGFDLPLEPNVERLLSPDGFLSREYGPRRSYHLCIVFGSDRSTRLHAPDICYTGAGWEVEQASTVPSPMTGSQAPSELMEIQLLREGEGRLTWYWYRSGGVSTASYGAFTWRALLRPQRPQALFWLSIPLDRTGLRRLERARERLAWFARTLDEPLRRVQEQL